MISISWGLGVCLESSDHTTSNLVLILYTKGEQMEILMYDFVKKELRLYDLNFLCSSNNIPL